MADDAKNETEGTGEERGKPRQVAAMLAGAGVAIAGVRLGPGAAIALGTFAYKFEEMIDKALAELRPEARRRAAQMLEAAADEADCDADRFDELIDSSEQNRLMTGLAIMAAERTTWPPQVIALGKVLGQGLIAEGDEVDLANYALDAMSEMGRLHVSLLDLLVRFESHWNADGYRAVPHRVASYQPHTFGVPPNDETFWSVGRRTWRAEIVSIVRPELTTVLPGLIGTLIRHGLAEQNDREQEAIEQLGKELHGQLQRQAAAIRSTKRSNNLRQPLAAPSVRLDRTWLPTQLGEIILGYYLEAGACDEASVN
jgi:hypothetical protein